MLVVPLLVLVCLPTAAPISLDQLWDYGLRAGDQTLPSNLDDVSSDVLHLSTPARFFSREFRSLFVNENGIVSLQMAIPDFYNAPFSDMNYPMIAVFYSDVDQRGLGAVYYRVVNSTESEVDTTKASQMVEDYFETRFQCKEVLVATWDQVGYFEQQSDKMNTYQLVMASDGDSTYVVFLYPEGGLQWIRVRLVMNY